ARARGDARGNADALEERPPLDAFDALHDPQAVTRRATAARARLLDVATLGRDNSGEVSREEIGKCDELGSFHSFAAPSAGRSGEPMRSFFSPLWKITVQTVALARRVTTPSPNSLWVKRCPTGKCPAMEYATATSPARFIARAHASSGVGATAVLRVSSRLFFACAEAAGDL